MCVCLFSPGHSLQIDYAAESITLKDGGKEIIVDLLVTNHSDRDTDRLHIVYPQAQDHSPSALLADKTDTWLEPEHELNRFYRTENTSLAIEPLDGRAKVSVGMPDPSDIIQTLYYVGWLQGYRELVPYQLAGDESLTPLEADILEQLEWSVMTLKFQRPLASKEARWLRLAVSTGKLDANRLSWLEEPLRRYTGQLQHKFEIAGPQDMRHRIISALRAAGLARTDSLPRRYAMASLLGLQDKLLVRGIVAPNTVTDVMDWRVNVFVEAYRQTSEPSYHGDIVPVGGLFNPVGRKPSGQLQWCYQWKSGDGNLDGVTHHGRFSIQFTARELPFVTLFLPWLACALAIAAVTLCVMNLYL